MAIEKITSVFSIVVGLPTRSSVRKHFAPFSLLESVAVNRLRLRSRQIIISARPTWQRGSIPTLIIRPGYSFSFLAQAAVCK
jgi:hypothetical protein